ncbi:MAG: dihydrofolate reductase [Burkholderiales bacterium]|jgi:dihydrofolate reductase|uniref:Dihydrofolate reductase n=1 Tax=Polynucleobacter sp. UK-FUSCHL-C3 TaxID=2955208 RepID=A0AAU8A435_9BURK|nr:dihydrofolate reductase [Burkholderiales bacterium]NBP20421.1 dihydrofolate reductase [Burkholderiaceae bacterium]NBP46963.1 dihydrofolate reductase [Burkholderiaceae bacterium]NBP93075.1 dihydrofolate reductase [Burkholderiaceae bacterium]NBQ29374.1 dihydrofolate reductase [Burkholderiaceae bacterium]
MSTPAISMIVARSRNHVIGKDNQMPWKISADLQFFKKVTMGYPIIMGRKTWESIGRPLPGRRNVVVSRNTNYSAIGAELVGSLDQALELLKEFKRVFVIGGQQLFTQAFPQADELFITEIEIQVDGDTYFEIPDPNDWQEAERILESEGDIQFAYVTLRRKAV